MRLICDRTTRVVLNGVDISDYVVGVLRRDIRLDLWQRSVLRLYSVPLQTPEMRRARRQRLAAMRSAYRRKRR